MRTKTLLLTAALSAVGVASSLAQVFSVNAVGYVNVTVAPGFQMIANPLEATSNTVSALLSNVPEGTIIYKFNSATGQYSINTFDFGEWSSPNETLAPGEGAFIRNPGTTAINVTFVGEVKQGALSNPIPAGFSIRSSQVPQTGTLVDLGFPGVDGDIVYKFNEGTQSYSIFSFDFGAWDPAPPVVEVGESVFVSKVAASSWNRTFSVNQ